MPRPGGNPGLAEAGKATRFGTPRNNAKEASLNSAKKRNASRKIAEYLGEALEMRDEKGQELKEKLALSLIKKAGSGDMQAYTLLLKLIGENPPDKHEISRPKSEAAEAVSAAVAALIVAKTGGGADV